MGRKVSILVLLVESFLLFHNAYCSMEKPPVVESRFGKIVGTWTKSARDLPVASYLGIPYAKPPIGDLRFRSPEPWTSPWTIREATKDGPPCMQRWYGGKIMGEEDCLYLNVFVPEITDARFQNYKRPVLAFIHGGSFNTGSGDSKHFAPTYWADQQVILVVMNYRLGPLGFFSLGSKPAPGNYGLKDMLLALKWVRENIEHFGGDPNLVTLMGQSAGAGAAHILALSEKTDGLFDKYILHSGSALAEWAVHPRKSIRESSMKMARSLGCPFLVRNESLRVENATELDQANVTLNEGLFDDEETDEFDEEITECMRSIDPGRILATISNSYQWKENPYCVFGPTLEDSSSEDAILSIPPVKMIEKHLFRDMPCIIGVVRDEGLLKTLETYLDDETRDLLIENFVELLPTFLEKQEVVTNETELARAIEDFYFDGNISYTFSNNVTEMVGDGLITWPTFRAVKYLSEVTTSSLYFFRFCYEGTYSGSFTSDVQRRYGINHGDDLNYFFPTWNNAFSELLLHNTENDWTMINIMTEMWANFMRNGVPRAWRTSEWPDYRDHREFMRFGAGREVDIVVESDFLPGRMEFWETLMGNVSEELSEVDQLRRKPENEREGQENEEEGGGEEEGKDGKSTKSEAYDLRAASTFLCVATSVVAWFL